MRLILWMTAEEFSSSPYKDLSEELGMTRVLLAEGRNPKLGGLPGTLFISPGFSKYQSLLTLKIYSGGLL